MAGITSDEKKYDKWKETVKDTIRNKMFHINYNKKLKKQVMNRKHILTLFIWLFSRANIV